MCRPTPSTPVLSAAAAGDSGRLLQSDLIEENAAANCAAMASDADASTTDCYRERVQHQLMSNSFPSRLQLF